MRAFSRQELAQLMMQGRPAVKTARVLARQLLWPFAVDTAHGQVEGRGGDWLVTNHPDDDPSADYWPVSAARFDASYRLLDESSDEVATNAEPPLPALYPVDAIGALVGIRAVLARSIREHDNSLDAITALKNLDHVLAELTKG